jgi:putative methionine-R-sulfoxide reductase with GAF domain
MLGSYHLIVLYNVLRDIRVLIQQNQDYPRFLESLGKALGAESTALFMLDSKKENLILKSCTGPKALLSQLKEEDRTIPMGTGICGWSVCSKQTLLVQDTATDRRFFPRIDSLTGYTTKNILCAPLASKGEVIGALELINKMNMTFSHNDMELMTWVGEETAQAIQNAELSKQYQTEKEFNDRLLSNLTSGFIAINNETKITHMNPVAESILHLAAYQCLGKTCQEAFYFYPNLCKELLQALESQQNVLRQEMVFAINQSLLHIGYSIFPIHNDAKKLLGAGLIFQVLPPLEMSSVLP